MLTFYNHFMTSILNVYIEPFYIESYLYIKPFLNPIK